MRAAEPAGVARGLTTLIQLMAAVPATSSGEIFVPGARILDAPRYAWRGLSLDLARAFFTLDEVRRVIDLLALYKLNVLHLHLTDDQSWRLPTPRPAGRPEAGGVFYSAGDLRAVAAYAAERFVTIVPEVDSPGHASALVQMYPELNTGRNEVEFELPPGHWHQAVWLDPGLPATFELIEQVLPASPRSSRAPISTSAAMSPTGCPTTCTRHTCGGCATWSARSAGARWGGRSRHAPARPGRHDPVLVLRHRPAGLGAPRGPDAGRCRPGRLAPRRRDGGRGVGARDRVTAEPLLPRRALRRAVGRSRAGGQTRPPRPAVLSPKTVAETFGWKPAGGARAWPAQVAGVEAAIWAETISGFDDLSFLLLPRLAGVAQKAWSGAQATTWTDHRDRLARHSPLWAQDNLTYFRASSVDWL